MDTPPLKLSLADRHALALEEVRALPADATDSSVIDIIERWCIEVCDAGCEDDECCDYQLLSSLVWGSLEVP